MISLLKQKRRNSNMAKGQSDEWHVIKDRKAETWRKGGKAGNGSTHECGLVFHVN